MGDKREGAQGKWRQRFGRFGRAWDKFVSAVTASSSWAHLGFFVDAARRNGACTEARRLNGFDEGSSVPFLVYHGLPARPRARWTSCSMCAKSSRSTAACRSCSSEPDSRRSKA